VLIEWQMIVKGDTKCFDRTGYRNGRASDIDRRDWWEWDRSLQKPVGMGVMFCPGAGLRLELHSQMSAMNKSELLGDDNDPVAKSPVLQGSSTASSGGWPWRWAFPATFCRRLSGCDVTSPQELVSRLPRCVSHQRPRLPAVLYDQIDYILDWHDEVKSWFCRSC